MPVFTVSYRCRSVSSKLKRTRLRVLPPIPRSIADVDIPDPWRKTWKGHHFLQLLDNVLGVAVFFDRYVSYVKPRNFVRTLPKCCTLSQQSLSNPERPHCPIKVLLNVSIEFMFLLSKANWSIF